MPKVKERWLLTRQRPYRCLTDRVIFFYQVFDPVCQWPHHGLTDQVFFIFFLKVVFDQDVSGHTTVCQTGNHGQKISLATFIITTFSEYRRHIFLQYGPQFVVQWIEVWAGGGAFSFFSSLCERMQNHAESTTHLSPQIQFPPEVIRHHLTWLSKPHHLFLHRHRKNEFGLHRSMAFPHQTITNRRGWWPPRFCLWAHNNFWNIYGYFGE